MLDILWISFKIQNWESTLKQQIPSTPQLAPNVHHKLPDAKVYFQMSLGNLHLFVPATAPCNNEISQLAALRRYSTNSVQIGLLVLGITKTKQHSSGVIYVEPLSGKPVTVSAQRGGQNNE